MGATKEHDMFDALDLIKATQKRREDAGLKVTWLITNEAEPRIYEAYAKDAEQAKRWRETPHDDRTLIS
jgi:hypothetical protein